MLPMEVIPTQTVLAFMQKQETSNWNKTQYHCILKTSFKMPLSRPSIFARFWERTHKAGETIVLCGLSLFWISNALHTCRVASSRFRPWEPNTVFLLPLKTKAKTPERIFAKLRCASGIPYLDIAGLCVWFFSLTCQQPRSRYLRKAL